MLKTKELIVGLALVRHIYFMYLGTSICDCLANHMHTARANKQQAHQCSAETDDKFGNYCVRFRGQQGAFTPRFGLYLVLEAGAGNYQVISLAHLTTDATCYLLTQNATTKHPSLNLLL